MGFWRVLRIIGFVLMVFGTIFFLADVYGYISGKIKINNGSSVEVVATMNYSELEYIEITHRRHSYRWITQVTYVYEDETYTDSNRVVFLTLPDNSPMTIYVDNENPYFYFYERDVSIISFLSIIYPVIGTSIYFIAKKNDW